MNPYIEEALTLVDMGARRTWKEARRVSARLGEEGRAVTELVIDVASYSARQARDRFAPAPPPPDPLETLVNALILRGQNGLVECKKHVAVAIAAEKRLAKQTTQEVANAEEWARRAVLAAAAGDAALLKEARSRKEEHEGRAKSLDVQWTRQRDDVARQKTELRLLNDKIETAKRKRDVVLERLRRAEAIEARQYLDRELDRLDALTRIVDGLSTVPLEVAERSAKRSEPVLRLVEAPDESS